MRCSEQERELGFTLVELLIAMVMALVVTTSIAGVFISQRKTFATQEQVSEMVQTARAAMDMITREVRMAGYDPTGTMQRKDPSEAGGIPFVGIPYNRRQLEIFADIDDDDGSGSGDGDTGDANEEIVYRFYDASDRRYPNQIKRKSGRGYFKAFAENIDAFNFRYLDADGNPTTSTPDIRQVEITITSRTARPDPDYTDPAYGDGYRRYTLTSRVTPPNLAL